MDKIPSGAGMPGGAGVDGAFERFLTAAIATIITIMFSWRLLAEEEEAMGLSGSSQGSQAPRLFPGTTTYRPLSQKTTSNDLKQTTAQQRSTSGICEIDIDEESCSRSARSTNVDQIDKELVVYDQYSPQQQQQLQATCSSRSEDTGVPVSKADDSLTDDTLTTWDEYKWEEETGQEKDDVIKTRRTVRDFVKTPIKNSPISVAISPNLAQTPVSKVETTNHTVPFSQRFADFVPDAGGDSGYIDLYPDVESDSDVTDSSDDERVYEIQVSDSDSDSEGDIRSGSFYGVTSLDTIMEEYESDVSDTGEPHVSSNLKTEASDTHPDNVLKNDTVNVRNENVLSENVQNNEVCDNGCDSTGLNQVPFETDIDAAFVYARPSQETGVLKSDSESSKLNDGFSQSGSLDKQTLTNLAYQQVKQDTLFSSGEPSNVECDLTHERTSSSDVNTNLPGSLIDKKHNSDLSINQNTPDICTAEDLYVQEAEIRSINQAKYETGNLTPAQQPSAENIIKPESLNLVQQSPDEYKISEISDDSLPPSPVRTCALDNLADEPFSDTESCSSGSVITVLSIKSNDSDNRTSDKINFIPASKGVPASGKNDLLIADDIADNANKYEHFSLVSGFLNDSLNSLLSANTGSEQESSSDRESSGPEVARTEPTPPVSHELLNGKTNSDDLNISSSESLPAVQEIIQVSNEIQLTENNCNGHTTSSDSLNNGTEQVSSYGQVEQIPDYVDSDASSDSSDPPLREYDPRDDDLAAFQFNLDSDDDSFYLLIGDSHDCHDDDDDDEGKLRNFETFTNLNSVGLSSDYGDAFTSHTYSDDGKSFTFSQTEELDTQYEKHVYFTERSNITESPGRVPLSPITSEDEEIKSEEKAQNKTEHETVSIETKSNLSAYQDAEPSVTNIHESEQMISKMSGTNDAIDFNKYIIKNDLSPVSQSASVFSTSNRIPSESISEAEPNVTHASKIDQDGDKKNNLGEKEMNNLDSSDGQAVTISSLNEQIGSLSGSDAVSLSKTDSNLAQGKSELDNTGISENSDFALQVNSKLETNIDDLFESSLSEKLDTSFTNSKETVIDDIYQDNLTEVESNKSKETNIDDLLTSAVEENKSLKFVQPKTIRRRSGRRIASGTLSKVETNIDDILTETPAQTSQQKVKVETCIDDIFEPEASVRTSLADTPDVKLETTFDCESVITNQSSYEEFVNILSSQSAVKPEITSESAITLENRHLESSLPSVEREKSVHVENNQILPQKDVHKSNVTDLDSGFILKQEPVERLEPSSTEAEISDIDKVIDNKTDNWSIQTIGKQAIDLQNERPIIDNYDQLSTQSLRPHSSENENYERNNAEDSENITNERYLSANERTGLISTENRLEKDNTQLLVSNLHSSPPELKDYNANIALPKSETLSKVRSGNLAGNEPEDNINQTDNKIDISTAEQTQSGLNVDLKCTLETPGINVDSLFARDDVKDAREDSETEIRSKYEKEDEQLDSIGSCSLSAYSDDESLSSLEESYNNIQATYNALQKLKLNASDSRVVRTPVTKPSDLFGRNKDLKGVKKRIHRQQLKKYTSVLQQPVTPEKVYVHIDIPERPASLSRLKVHKSRERFLSAENLASDSFEDKFLKHRTSLVTSTPRKYLKRHERELQSTESLPADMSSWNESYGSNHSMDYGRIEHGHIHVVPVPRRIEEAYQSRYSSANSSFEHGEIDKLHANCIFSPKKREELEEIRHTTKSLENMFEQLLRYGSVSSVAETDLDAPDVEDHFLSFQYPPLERAASMSALFGSSDSARPAKKPSQGKGRFANRKVPKSKSLQTLETNLDDVFVSELGQPGELQKTPSVHELRVSKSLSKLNVPDWFKKSSFSRAGSTQSLFTYAGRTGSTSTLGSYAYPPSITSSPTPSVTPGSNTVVIQKRVTPSPTSPSTSKVLRAPMLPTTPERAPIHDIPSATLPSDKYRKQEKDKLKPIPILPFAKIREMFEKKVQENAANANATTPTKEKHSPTKEFKSSPTKELKSSPTKERTKVHFEPIVIPIISEPNDHIPVQNRIESPPPPLPERKPILTETIKQSDITQPRKQQVHFSDEKKVSTPQEQKVDSKRQNGTTQSTSSSTAKKPSGLRAALPQFKFRRPGVYATKVAATNPQKQTATQSKKGKQIDFYDDYVDSAEYQVNNDISINTPPPAWLHVLEHKAKTDGETLFEFLQKRRYSSILENGFSEQMDELQEKDVTFNFPVMAVSNHSSNGDLLQNDSPDLRVVLTNAHNNAMQNGFVKNKLRSDAPVDDILDGILLLEGHQTGRMRIDENGRIVPKSPDDYVLTPDTPPGFAFLHPGQDDVDSDLNIHSDGHIAPYDVQSEYILVKCENPQCNRETNLKEARKFFKSCHSCFTYYCSRSCRKDHWSPHKLACVYSRIKSACKHVITAINKQPHLQYQCSRIARRGYLSQGRGCVVFAFPDIGSAEDFLTSGMESLWVPPVYVSLKELPNAVMLGSKLNILTETCKQYNPEIKYVIHVAIVIPPQLPYRPVPRRLESIIQKCAKLRLSPAHMHPKQEDSHVPSTLILTAVPGNQQSDEGDGRKTRELCFINIQRKLRHRGVSLRHHFPEVYNKLIDFVSDAKHFSPLIIYPVDGRTGKRFMCVIMPESEPEIEWIRDPDLFHELDVFEDEDTETSSPSYTIQHEVML